MTNYNAKPNGEALYDLCSHPGVAHVAVEHATGIGYSPVFEETPYTAEIATCDLYLTYSDKEVATRIRFGEEHQRASACPATSRSPRTATPA